VINFNEWPTNYKLLMMLMEQNIGFSMVKCADPMVPLLRGQMEEPVGY
jgi:hypothetical protein